MSKRTEALARNGLDQVPLTRFASEQVVDALERLERKIALLQKDLDELKRTSVVHTLNRLR